MKRMIRVGKHEGIIIDEDWDWDGYICIFYCFKCKKLHKYDERLSSSTTELLRGEVHYSSSLKDYTPDYALYEEYVQRVRKMGYEVVE